MAIIAHHADAHSVHGAQMRKFVLEDGSEGEDEGAAFTAVAPTTATRIIVGFTAAAAVATTTATITTTVTVTTGGDYDDDDGNNSNAAAACRPGNRAAAKSATFT
jgi:hypothetical protein